MNNLYFVRLIARAFQQPDLKNALKEAFKQIESLGRRSEHKQDFPQFLRFMAEVKRNCEKVSWESDDYLDAMLHDLSFQLATGLFDGDKDEAKAALSLINSRPHWREHYGMLCEEARKSEGFSGSMEVIVEKDGGLFDSFTIGEKSVTREISNIKPGDYTVKLDTGRVVWQERLNERDLLWVYAFPEYGLRLAADTGDSISLKTRDVLVLDGEGAIRVYPGVESGRLELKFRGMRNDSNTE
jgi:hypothetical protein